MLPRLRLLVLLTLATALAWQGAVAQESGFENLPPYKMIRSLEFVQDAIVNGDHSAMEMQRFLIGEIDDRLRKAEPEVFDDPKNVDAALIYAMSGGNPETLDYLAAKDARGNFDNRVTDALSAYFTGGPERARPILATVVDEFLPTRIGPYLALVTANAMANSDPEKALKYFDLTRLGAPGTILEESALRRSILIANRKQLVDRSMHYSLIYSRRFLYSPYATQFADLFVDLIVSNLNSVNIDKIEHVMSYMDPLRRREVYLRLARKATIAGEKEFTLFATGRAEELTNENDDVVRALTGLYSGLVEIPTDKIGSVVTDIMAIPASSLTRRDQALREAARLVAEEVMREPNPETLTQANASIMPQEHRPASDDLLEPEPPKMEVAKEALAQLPSIPAEPADVMPDEPLEPDVMAEKTEAGAMNDAKTQEAEGEEAASDLDTEVKDFLKSGRARLAEIDKLLDGDTN